MEIYKALTPVPQANGKKINLSAPIPDLSGKTICAVRHTFRADESFRMIEALFKEKYRDIHFISNFDMPDSKASNAEEENELILALKEKGAEIVLAGNGA